jgi:hypothetical protein
MNEIKTRLAGDRLADRLGVDVEGSFEGGDEGGDVARGELGDEVSVVGSADQSMEDASE